MHMITALIQSYVYGVVILITAIVFTIAAKTIGLSTWYDYIFAIQKSGIYTATAELSIPSGLSLFLIYPMLLGAIVLILPTQ